MANYSFSDLTGKTLGRLHVIALATRGANGRLRWQCRCDCGVTKIIPASHFTRTHSPTRSCGCLQVEHAASFRRTHGRYRTPEYGVWEGIIQRCTNQRNPAYADYGGRGITVCDRWRQSFAAFLADMGERPTSKHSIERSDNDRGYEPGNCVWATRGTQQRNRRTARLITFQGRTETAHMWSKITGIPSRTVTNRLNAGWPPERILTTPPAASGFGARKVR